MLVGSGSEIVSPSMPMMGNKISFRTRLRETTPSGASMTMYSKDRVDD